MENRYYSVKWPSKKITLKNFINFSLKRINEASGLKFLNVKLYIGKLYFSNQLSKVLIKCLVSLLIFTLSISRNLFIFYISEDLVNIPRDQISPKLFYANLVPRISCKSLIKKFTKEWFRKPKKSLLAIFFVLLGYGVVLLWRFTGPNRL